MRADNLVEYSAERSSCQSCRGRCRVPRHSPGPERHRQGTGNREQGTGNREQGTGNREIIFFLKLLCKMKNHFLCCLFIGSSVRRFLQLPLSYLASAIFGLAPGYDSGLSLSNGVSVPASVDSLAAISPVLWVSFS